jgi:hypothetical protein
MNRFAALLLAVMPAAALAQRGTEIDACGYLVQGRNCVLFDGGGGLYSLSDYGSFRLGDYIRVIGTIDENCRTICEDDADGCIRGAVVYNPEINPCGEPIPSFPYDGCAAAAAGLGTTAILGLRLTRGRRRE